MTLRLIQLRTAEGDRRVAACDDDGVARLVNGISSTYDLARAALEVANYGYVLETGDIGLHGAAAELAGDPRVIETYLGAARAAATGGREA